jgi:hypothetical protein
MIQKFTVLYRLLKVILQEKAVMVRRQPVNRAEGLFAVPASEGH